MILTVAVVMAAGTAYGMRENMAARVTQKQSDKQQNIKEQVVKAQIPEQKKTDNYPEKGFTFTISFSTGGETDTLMCIVGAEVEKVTGHVLIINDMPGSGGAADTAESVEAAPGGYTIAGTSVYGVPGSVFLDGSSMEYAETDFKYICGVDVGGGMFVANLPTGLESIEEMIEFTQEYPGELTVSTSGATHNPLLGILEDQLDVKVTDIAYSDRGDSFNALMGNHVDVALAGRQFTSRVEGADLKVFCMMAPEEIVSLPGISAFCSVYPEAKLPVSSRSAVAPKDMSEDVAERLGLLVKGAADIKELRNKVAESSDLYQLTTGEGAEATLAEAGKTLKVTVERNPAMFGPEQ